MLNNGVKLLTNMLKCVRTVYLQEGEVTTAIELICELDDQDVMVTLCKRENPYIYRVTFKMFDGNYKKLMYNFKKVGIKL